MKKGGTGGNHTTTGAMFEQLAEIKNTLAESGYTVKENDNQIANVYDKNGDLVGYCFKKHQLYDFLNTNYGINWKEKISGKLLPDNCFFNVKTGELFVIECKYQSGGGSVDEKPQTCGFKLRQFKKLCENTDINVSYSYIFNDWYHDKKYTDMLDYIKETGCHYFFNNISVNFLMSE